MRFTQSQRLSRPFAHGRSAANEQHWAPTRSRNRNVCALGAVALCLVAGVPAFAAPLNAAETYGAWTLRCENRAGNTESGAVEAAPAEKQCFIFQTVVMKQSGQRVFNIAIGFLPENPQPIAVLTLPLGISLPPGARLQINGGPTLEFLIEQCVPAGCRAGGSINETLREALSAAPTATVAFQDGARQDLAIELSLEGFAEALRALEGHR